MEISTNDSSHIFCPLESLPKSAQHRRSNAGKSRPRMDLKGLINFIESSSHSSTPKSQKSKSFNKPDTPNIHFRGQNKTPLSPILTKSHFCEPRPETVIKPLNSQNGTQNPTSPSLREKRLYNAQAFNNLVNGFSLEKSQTPQRHSFTPFTGKTLVTRESSPKVLIKNRRLNISVNTKVTNSWNHQEISTSHSIELLPKEGTDLGIRKKKGRKIFIRNVY